MPSHRLPFCRFAPSRTISQLISLYLLCFPALLVAGEFRPAKRDGVPGRYAVVLENQRSKAGNAEALLETLSAKYMAKKRMRLSGPRGGAVLQIDRTNAEKMAAHPDVALVEQIARFTSHHGMSGGTQLDIELQNRITGAPATGEICGQDVHVFVVDTGIRASHYEFEGRVDNSPGNFFDAFGTDGSDDNGHGTHTAGLVGGKTIGTAPCVILHPVKVLDAGGSGLSNDVKAGFDFIADWMIANPDKPVVAVFSGGVPGTNVLVNTAVQRVRDQGGTVVVAAGNDAADACAYSPASSNSAIVIGAVDTNSAITPFSNIGGCVDLFAPGIDLISAWHQGDHDLIRHSGTSVAAPLVAGKAACFLEGEPSLDPDTIETLLLTSSIPNTITNPYADTTTSRMQDQTYIVRDSAWEGSGRKEPCTWYMAPMGIHTGLLIVPNGTNMDLFLERLDQGSWTEVDASLNTSGNELITYNGPGGLYRWRIEAVSGSGDFSFYWSKP